MGGGSVIQMSPFGWAFCNRLISALGPVEDFHVNDYLLQKTLLWRVLRDVLVYWDKNIQLGASLIECSLSRIMVAASPLGPMVCPATGSWPPKLCQVWDQSCGTRYPFYNSFSHGSGIICLSTLLIISLTEEKCQIMAQSKNHHFYFIVIWKFLLEGHKEILLLVYNTTLLLYFKIFNSLTICFHVSC